MDTVSEDSSSSPPRWLKIKKAKHCKAFLIANWDETMNCLRRSDEMLFVTRHNNKPMKRVLCRWDSLEGPSDHPFQGLAACCEELIQLAVHMTWTSIRMGEGDHASSSETSSFPRLRSVVMTMADPRPTEPAVLHIDGHPSHGTNEVLNYSVPITSIFVSLSPMPPLDLLVLYLSVFGSWFGSSGALFCRTLCYFCYLGPLLPSSFLLIISLH